MGNGLARGAVAVALVAATGLLAGCGSGGSSSASGSVASSRKAAGSTSREVMGPVSQGGSSGPGALGRAPVLTRQVISTGDVSLESRHLSQVRAELDGLLARYGGFVAREDTSNDGHGRTVSSRLVLRVPSQHFDTVMAAFGRLGTVTDTSRRSEDVTTEVIDVSARIRTAEVSLRRLRSFLGRAHDVDAIVRLESDITERESQLRSLESQQRYLDDATSLSTITVTMTRAPGSVPAPEPRHAGFLAGLRGGWSALVAGFVVAATVLGALLPFLVLAGLVGVPLAVWLRRRRRTPRAA